LPVENGLQSVACRAIPRASGVTRHFCKFF